MVVPVPLFSMIVPVLFEEWSMTRVIWIICLIVGFTVFKVTPMDPVQMPVLDVNSLDAVTPSVVAADSEPKQSTAEPAAAKPQTAEQVQAQQPQPQPPAPEPSTAQP